MSEKKVFQKRGGESLIKGTRQKENRERGEKRTLEASWRGVPLRGGGGKGREKVAAKKKRDLLKGFVPGAKNSAHKQE